MLLTRAQRRAAEVKLPPSLDTKSEENPSSQQPTTPMSPSPTRKTRKRRTSSSSAAPKKSQQLDCTPQHTAFLSASLLTLIASTLIKTNLYWTTDDILTLLEQLRANPTPSLSFLCLQMVRFLSTEAKMIGINAKKYLGKKRDGKVFATAAKRDYTLSDGDLSTLPYDVVNTAVWGQPVTGRKFSAADVRLCARRKHGSFELRILRTQQRMDKQDAKKAEVKMQRENRIFEAFARLGLDEPTCSQSYQYIERGIGNARKIAKSVYEMKCRQDLVAEVVREHELNECSTHKFRNYVEDGTGDPYLIAALVAGQEIRKDTITNELLRVGLNMNSYYYQPLVKQYIYEDIGNPVEIAEELGERKNRKELVSTLLNNYDLHPVRFEYLCKEYVETGKGDPVSIVSDFSARMTRETLLRSALSKYGFYSAHYSNYFREYLTCGTGDYLQTVATFGARKDIVFEELAKNGYRVSPNSSIVSGYICTGVGDPVLIGKGPHSQRHRISPSFV
ncbi:hypothetical protein RCL1_009174 [Eukaryota sp. TZLM3-RCL]